MKFSAWSVLPCPYKRATCGCQGIADACEPEESPRRCAGSPASRTPGGHGALLRADVPASCFNSTGLSGSCQRPAFSTARLPARMPAGLRLALVTRILVDRLHRPLQRIITVHGRTHVLSSLTVNVSRRSGLVREALDHVQILVGTAEIAARREIRRIDDEVSPSQWPRESPSQLRRNRAGVRTPVEQDDPRVVNGFMRNTTVSATG